MDVVVDPDEPLTVFYLDTATGYDVEEFRLKFPEGTMFEY
jgi:hypothetical protein